MIREIRRRVAAALCRHAFRIQPDDEPIIYDGMGVWPPHPLPTPAQQAHIDWLFSDVERDKRWQERRADQQCNASVVEPWVGPVASQAEVLGMSV
jgi:hypothetical protein